MRHRTPSVVVALSLGTMLGCAAAMPAPAAVATPEPAVDTTVFAVLLGTDTLAVERSTRGATRLTAELALRQERMVQTWEIDLGANGLATGGGSAVRSAAAGPDDPPLQAVRVTFEGDSATNAAGGTQRRVAVPAGTLPFVNLSARVVEQIVRQARATGGDPATVPLLPIGTTQAIPAQVRWPGADSAVIAIGGVALHATVDAAGTLLAAAVPAQGVRFVRVPRDTPLFAAVASAPRDYSAPAGAPYTAHDVTFRNDAANITLAGTLTLPQGASAAARVPAVVFISGSGPQDRDGSSPAIPGWAPFRELADTLSRRGIAVLRVDDRGVGGSQAGPATVTSEDFAGDVRAALAWLRTRPEIDPARLSLLGHSEGGIIAPMVARTDSTLRAVVLVAAQSRTGRVVSDSQVSQALAERGVPAEQRAALVRANIPARDSLASANPWIAFWLDYDPLPAARALRVPVLIVQGATDRQVSADQATELAAAIRAAGNPDVTTAIIPNVNHLLVPDPDGAPGGYRSLPSYDVAPEVLGVVVEWVVGKME